jgi:alpha-L-fucosidase
VVPDGVVNNRFDFVNRTRGTVHADFVTPEYSSAGIPDRKFEGCRGIGTSFGYNQLETDADYLSGEALIHFRLY